MLVPFGTHVVDKHGKSVGTVSRVVLDSQAREVVSLVVHHGVLNRREVEVPLSKVTGFGEEVRLSLASTEFNELVPFHAPSSVELNPVSWPAVRNPMSVVLKPATWVVVRPPNWVEVSAPKLAAFKVPSWIEVRPANCTVVSAAVLVVVRALSCVDVKFPMCAGTNPASCVVDRTARSVACKPLT